MSEKSSAAEADQWVGTYKLISATRTDLETGQVMVGEPLPASSPTGPTVG